MALEYKNRRSLEAWNRGVIFMIENNELYSYEKEWLEKMLSTEFPQKEDIVKQINLAKISCEIAFKNAKIEIIIYYVGGLSDGK